MVPEDEKEFLDDTGFQLKKKKKLSRVGTMFGRTQFCYAEKPGGKEPGFRAIDLNEVFFIELKKILRQPGMDEFATLLSDLEKEDLRSNQKDFSTFINHHVQSPHEPGALPEGIDFLCQKMKEAVSKNQALSAWMYKLDYPADVSSKDRFKTNREALREYVGTKLSGIFSDKNQHQEIAWVHGSTGPHALLACAWQNGLQELTKHLYGGEEPDYQGVLVTRTMVGEVEVLVSKTVPLLGPNLIWGIALGDRDGIGKDAQNKGIVQGAFYGFDYGKPYENKGVCDSLNNDFSFQDPGAGVPAQLRSSNVWGVYRHYMYRNYNIFYDTSLSDRMYGVHLLSKMVTGKNPDKEILDSYPGLEQELARIEARTPSIDNLLERLSDVKIKAKSGSGTEKLIDELNLQIKDKKSTNFDRYFAEIKIDLINSAIDRGMPEKELQRSIAFIDGMAKRATINNQQILNVLQSRSLLKKEEVDFIDKLEKLVSPASIMSHDGKVFLNHLRIDPPEERVSFKLQKKSSGNYILTTADKKIQQKVEKCIDRSFNQTKEGLVCLLSPKELEQIMGVVDEKYADKKKELLIQPTFNLVTLPVLSSLVGMAKFEPTRRADNSVSLRFIAYTKEQVKKMQEIFGTKPGEITLGQPKNFIISAKDQPVLYRLVMAHAMERSAHEKWAQLKGDAEEKYSLTDVKSKLIDKFEALFPREQYIEEQLLIRDKMMGDITEAIIHMSDHDVNKLLTYADETLMNPENIDHIIEQDVGRMINIEKEPESASSVEEELEEDYRAVPVVKK